MAESPAPAAPTREDYRALIDYIARRASRLARPIETEIWIKLSPEQARIAVHLSERMNETKEETRR